MDGFASGFGFNFNKLRATTQAVRRTAAEAKAKAEAVTGKSIFLTKSFFKKTEHTEDSQDVQPEAELGCPDSLAATHLSPVSEQFGSDPTIPGSWDGSNHTTGGVEFQVLAENDTTEVMTEKYDKELESCVQPGLKGDNGTSMVPSRGDLTEVTPGECETKTLIRSEFEKTALIQGGVTEEEQERYVLEDLEEQEVTANTSAVSFVINRSKDDVPVFSGNIADYKDWRLSFQSYMAHFPKYEHLETLKNKLGPSKRLISGCSGITESALSRAWDILDSELCDKEILKRELLAQLRRLLSVPYTTNTNFVDTIRHVRDRFDRLLRVDGTCVFSANNDYLEMLLKSMPRWLATKLINKYQDGKIDWTFNTILKKAEEALVGIRLQDFYLKDSGRGGASNINALSVENTYCDSKEFDYPKDVNAAGTSNTFQGGSQFGGRGSGRGVRGRGFVQGNRTSEISQNSRSRGHKQRPDMTNAWAQCMVCDVNDHKTVDCKVAPAMEPGKLKALTELRKICLLCGRPNHLAKHCPLFTVAQDSRLLCKDSGCASDPHAKVFCGVAKKT